MNGNVRNKDLNIVANGLKSILLIDAETLQICAVQLTTNDVSDSQVLEPSDEQIDSIYVDVAYDTKHCRQVILDRNAHSVIPEERT